MSIIGSNILAGASGQAGGGGAYEVERSVRFSSSDSAYLGATFGTPTDQDVFTLSMWVKRSALGSTQHLFGVSTNHSFGFTSGDALNLTFSGSSALTTTALFRDPSAWYHIMWVQNGTAHTLYVNGASVGTATATSSTFNTAVAHQIGAGNTANFFNGYLAYIHFIDGQAKPPSSFGANDNNGIWQPLVYAGGYGNNGFQLEMDDNSTAAALGTDTSGNGNDWTVNNIVANTGTVYSNNVVSSTGAFYSTFTPDKLFDGSTATTVLPEPNVSTNYWTCTFSPALTGTIELYIQQNSPTTPIEINGTTYFPSGTGWYTSPISTVSSIKAYGDGSGTFRRINAVRVNGTILVDGVPANTDSLVDSPTNGSQVDTGAGGEVRGNYCTLNPLTSTLGGGSGTSSNGNLEWIGTGGNDNIAGTMSASSGKFYYEVTIIAQPTTVVAGWSTTEAATHYTTSALFFYESAGIRIGTKTSVWNVDVTTGLTFATNDVIGFAIDIDGGDLKVYQNNSLVSTITLPTDKGNEWIPCIGDSSASDGSVIVNFGQRQWAYAAPAGFKALCTTNLPEPTIADGSTAMDVALYTGNGSTQTISGLNFDPDLVWIKGRSGATDHALYDTVRTATKQLESNTTTAETTEATGLTAFATGGFSLGALAQVNTSSATYVAWTWDAGSSTVTNTQGSISSQVRANASAGFSIVTYTGPGSGSSTVGHGLGVIPGMVFVKARSSSGNWWVTHSAMNQSNPPSGFSDYLTLNTTAAKVPGTYDVFSPHTSSVISLGSDGVVSSSSTYVAYCFAPVAGYSAYGSYTGNGSADGPFVFCNFRPAVVLVKMSSSTGNWTILDDKREGYNVDNDPLFPNLSNAEGTTDLIDITSNGFKVRTTDATFNTNAGTYVYAAWASSPFAYSRAR